MAKKILIVSRSFPLPHTTGSATHILDFVSFLQAEGRQVQFLYLSPKRIDVPPELSALLDVTTADADALGPRPSDGDLAWPRNYDSLASSMELEIFRRAFALFEPDVVVADYDWMAGIFDAIPGDRAVKKIIFLHDLRTRILPSSARMGIAYEEHWDEAKEGALLEKADAVLVLQVEDEEACRRMAADVAIIRIGISVDPIACDPADEIEGRLIYVGSRLKENLIPLVSFLAQTWPVVRETVPYVTLDVCGDVCDYLKAPPDGLMAPPDGVILSGRVNDLGPHYAAAQVAIIPHQLQGGMKLKFVGALAHGRAVVANTCGIDGLPEAAGTCAFVSDDPMHFAIQTIHLLVNETTRQAMEQAARDLAAARLSPQACYGAFLSFVDTGRLEAPRVA